ncbi:TIGR02302 family protein [uncultured Rhodospira sp.]|uniref:TIGR02302 family protein n=1 Tax=uncultured Rhodospira sp. TaxID=1936189 RepID=UPI002639554A|nr:TIGR02302 family protein [uncultured Rhodospira sp.]
MALSRLALTGERAAQRLWPAASLVGVVLAILLSGLLPALPWWAHLGALLGLATIVALALAHGLRGWRWPTRRAALRRLEATAPPGYRPASETADRLALGAGDPLSRALWRHHQATLRTQGRGLRVMPPRPGLARRDPRAFRILSLLVLAVALVAAGPESLDRLARALTPGLGGPAAPVLAQVWITPPEYTGQPPVMLETGSGPDDNGGGADEGRVGTPSAVLGTAPDAAPLAIPAGAEVVTLLRGGSGQGRVDFGASGPPRDLEPAGEGGQSLTTALPDAAARIRLTQRGHTILDQPLLVVPDRPPRVAWTALPRAESRGRLGLAYRPRDDHGVTAVVLQIRAASDQVLGAPVDLDLPPGEDGAEQIETRDLSAHPWAGTTVTVRLQAKDGAGQVGLSEPVSILLPARRFSHPVAQAVVDARRHLVVHPERARPVGARLSAMAEDYASRDESLAVYLTLKAAAARLLRRDLGRAVDADLELLWSIALAIEDGTLTLARRDLREAREALREALDQGAPREEIQRRLDQLREAMDRLMQALAEAMPLADMPLMAMPDGADLMTPQDLEHMLNRLGDLSDLGADDAAQALLDQLDAMLRQLESARPPTAAERRAMAEAAEMMDRLRDVVTRQQALLDETFRQGQESTGATPPRWPDRPPEARRQPGESLEDWFRRQPPLSNQAPAPRATPETQRLGEQQRALRRALEDLMTDLGERLGRIPGALGEANMAMRDAEQALAEGRADAAARAQGRALDALTRGQGQAMGQMMGQPGSGGAGFGMIPARPGPGGVPGFPGPRPGFGRDPFNRPMGAADDGSVEVPSEPDTQRAHDILRELRRRANEPDRPTPERRFLDRLMDAF